MRLIGTLNDAKSARRFSDFLKAKGVDHELEAETVTDWGSPHYKESTIKIWVADEDQFEDAADWLNTFRNNPNDPLFKAEIIPLIQPQAIFDKDNREVHKAPEYSPPATGIVTLYFLISCIILYAATILTTPPREVPEIPFPQSEVMNGLFIDFPKAYELRDQLITTYGVIAWQQPAKLPPDGQKLLAEMNSTPWWKGYYNVLLTWLQGHPPAAWETQSLWLEKVRQGEVWRLFTPCLLHGTLIHIVFNMIWLVILGREIEPKLGPFRYILFIILAGILSNIAQYLMSGPDFLGFSGVVCAMLGFIWARQRLAPWEGYALHPSTTTIMGVYIGGLLLLQVASFVSEVYAGSAFAPAIANTAHVSGALLGAAMGYMNFFNES